MFRKLRKIRQRLRSKKRKKEFGKYAQGVLYDTENGLIIAPVGDLMIGKHLGFKGRWDMDEVNLLLQFIAPDDVVYFVGTHVGTLLVPIAKHCKSVVAYEANPDTFKLLKANILLNEINNATIYNYAIGDADRKVKFYKNNVNTGGSKIKPIRDKFIYSFDAPELVEVPMINLNEHVIQEKLAMADVVIMDIEGAEYLALQGMSKVLDQLKILYIEFVPDHLIDIADVSVSDFLNLIVPYFDTVKLVNANVSYDIAAQGSAFLTHLEQLSTMENLVFTKS